MALINCPECGEQISTTASLCPHCGYRQDTIKPTAIDSSKRRHYMGLSVTALGAIICAIGMFFLVIFFPIGVFLLIVSGMIMASGVFKGKNAQSCICPYCEKCGRIAVGADGYTCPACNKRSIRRGNHLYAAEET